MMVVPVSRPCTDCVRTLGGICPLPVTLWGRAGWAGMAVSAQLEWAPEVGTQLRQGSGWGTVVLPGISRRDVQALALRKSPGNLSLAVASLIVDVLRS